MKTIKNVLLIALPMLLFSCNEELTVKGLRLNFAELQLQENHDTLLVAEVDPGKLISEVSWRSMDESVASVDAEGRVKGLVGGRTFILASVGGLTKGCAVTVFARVEGVVFDVSSMFLSVEESREIKITVSPERALNKKMTWTSSDPDVAIVSGGIVVGKSIGKTVITAVSEDNPSISASCEVEVGVPVSGIVVSPKEGSLYVGETLQLTGTVAPEDASHPDIVWTSSNEEIATVNDDGLVSGISAGTVQITAEAPYGGVSASCTLEVRSYVSGVSLDKHNVDIYSLETIQLIATVQPENAFNKEVSWNSANPLIATVDEEGRVTGRSKGSTVITVTTKDGGFTDACTVNVVSGTAAVSEVKFEKNLYILTLGKTMEIIPVVLPVDAGDKSVTWEISDKTIASISDAGIITGLKQGTATITATSVNNPAAKASCTLKVIPFGGGIGGGYDDNDYNWED